MEFFIWAHKLLSIACNLHKQDKELMKVIIMLRLISPPSIKDQALLAPPPGEQPTVSRPNPNSCLMGTSLAIAKATLSRGRKDSTEVRSKLKRPGCQVNGIAHSENSNFLRENSQQVSLLFVPN